MSTRQLYVAADGPGPPFTPVPLVCLGQFSHTKMLEMGCVFDSMANLLRGSIDVSSWHMMAPH